LLPDTLLLRPGGAAYAWYRTCGDGYAVRTPSSALSLHAFSRALRRARLPGAEAVTAGPRGSECGGGGDNGAVAVARYASGLARLLDGPGLDRMVRRLLIWLD
jgi:hypothetical protein